jgi:D-tyrosyl-tRNA(Tyr) deacylase
VRLLLQRVSRAAVRVGDEQVGAIGPGLLVFVGVARGDDPATAEAMSLRVAELRIFADEAGQTNRSIIETRGAALIVSQFTLLADTSRGRRPGFSRAASGDVADALYRRFADALRRAGVGDVQMGRFGAVMAVELVNDGPFTIWLDSDGSPGRASEPTS